MSKKQQKQQKLEQHSQLKNVEHTDNDFICPICLHYIVQAVSTKCGHTYCEICLHEYLLYFKECPICKENMRKSRLAFCYILDQIIADFIQQHHPEELPQYEQKKQQNKKWRKEKQVGEFEVGQKLDVRDPNFVWKVGIIKRLKICQDQARTKYLVIHYDGSSEKHDEEIPENSPRFAAYQFYTGRKDIPKYYTGQGNPFLKKLLYIENLNCNDSQFNERFFLQDESSQSE